ncbi:sterol 3-beta-glucosyltransferase UGT80A2 isoform X1 [Brassica rapa]|uniref:sterol 3beta-glucosyltransferase n=1 Tax=Brassica campestris TaxID=3711 RepID=M4FGX7_BRACM|nr:sterol 3-beta-glucosyltransferase UGT80A2 isoform X1 [Brassica rapa]
MPELSPAKLDRASSSSSSSSSDRTSVKIEEIEGGRCSAVVNGSEEVESKPDPPVASIADNAVSESSGGGNKSFSRVWSMPVESSSSSDMAESSSSSLSSPSSSKPKLVKSMSERQQILAEDAAKIFDDTISAGKKLKLLNRIATVKHDGSVEFEVPADAIPQPIPVDREEESSRNGVCPDESIDGVDLQYIPHMQIVMLIVGTRGDVQPFVAIAKRLQEYGHRVRLATHANFKEFVLTAGLEFYPLGGDPKVLAEYMVKNKGFLPSGPSEIQIQRKQMKDIINSLLPACKEPDPDSGNSFKADAIIANPPAYGHTHVAEALRIPIHVFFTMPWTPTSEFPHPLSRVKQPAGYRLSYHIVDSLIWLGIRDMIKDLRKKKLKLRPVSYLSGTQGSGSNIPHGYMWSPNLVPKPKDWGPQIDVVGFCFLDLASNYEPPAELVEWLEAGDKPIYIGFGSLPVQEPEKMTEIIVEALQRTKQRGIINKGWGGLGNLKEPKDFVYLLDNVPHDWLFPRCKAVVHHGGAGTTAAGLKAACPTTIVPFFGDQPFWGERVHARGVGPAPIPVDEFSLHKLEDAINFMLDEKVKSSAETLANEMKDEDGVAGAVKAFFKHLPSTQPISPDHIPEPSGLLSFRRWFACS